VQTFCVRNIPDKIGVVKDTWGFTTTMKTRFMFALNVGQFCCVRFVMAPMLFVIERNKNKTRCGLLYINIWSVHADA
jgi:hypothetical protein